jgi:hypothetical protein
MGTVGQAQLLASQSIIRAGGHEARESAAAEVGSTAQRVCVGSCGAGHRRASLRSEDHWQEMAQQGRLAIQPLREGDP